MLVSHHRWPAVAVLIAATALIDWVYLAPRRWTLPAKFLIPGTVFLIGFQVVPILYTINVAFSNYSIGHILTKSQAIEAIKVNSLDQLPNSRQFDMAVARTVGGNLVLLLHDQGKGGQVYVGTGEGPHAAREGVIHARPDRAAGLGEGLHAGQGRRAVRARPAASQLQGSDDGVSAIRPQGTSSAVELAPTLRYDGEDRHVRAAERRHGVPRQRPRLVRRAAVGRTDPAGRARAGLEDVRRLRQLQQDDPRPADQEAVPVGVRLDVRLRAPRSSCSRSRSGCSSRSRWTRRVCASRGSTARRWSSRGRSPGSSRSSSGPAC